MTYDNWEKRVLQSNENDNLWEIYHENSKVGRYNRAKSSIEIVAIMKKMYESLPYVGYRSIQLPRTFSKLQLGLEETILARVTARKMEPANLSLTDVGAIFHYAYGITRDNTDTEYPRSFRTVPSGGALYPLELYFYSRYIENLETGLYHYNPVENNLHQIIAEDLTLKISNCLTPGQSNLAHNTSMMIFITSIFERETFKYGSRGYRFALLEAGHVAQNINLVSTAMGLGSVNIGGYFDREVDELIGIDGVTHSTIYMIGIGKPLKED